MSCYSSCPRMSTHMHYAHEAGWTLNRVITLEVNEEAATLSFTPYCYERFRRGWSFFFLPFCSFILLPLFSFWLSISFLFKSHNILIILLVYYIVWSHWLSYFKWFIILMFESRSLNNILWIRHCTPYYSILFLVKHLSDIN